jgi:hypothetical protein
MSALPVTPAVLAILRADGAVTGVYRKIDSAFGLAEAAHAPIAPALYVTPIQERPGVQNAMTLDQPVICRIGCLLVIRRAGSALPNGDISDFCRPVIKALRGRVLTGVDLPNGEAGVYAGGTLAGDGEPAAGELRWLLAFDFRFTLCDLP